MTLLGGEPWCFHTEKIARLTDYQILHVYVVPAVEKAKRFQREHGGGAPPVRGDADTRSPQEKIVATLMALGMSYPDAKAYCDAQKKDK